MEQAIGFLTYDGRNVAYATVGDGPAVVVPPWWISHLDREWQDPRFRRFFSALAERHTVVRYDRIGVGLSDRDRGPKDMSLAAEVGLLRATLDHLGLERCSMVGVSCGACIAAGLAADEPERVERLVMFGGYARGHEIAPRAVREALVELIRATWGFGSRVLTEALLAGADANERQAYVEFQQAATSAELAAALLELTFSFDTRAELARLAVPTTVLHRTEDATVPFACGREVAALVDGAHLVPLAGTAHQPWRGDASGVVQAIARALDADDPDAATAAHASQMPAFELTGREREVLVLVARGFTDSQIAEQLVISPHTVHRHVANILARLGVSSRAAAATAAGRAGLV